MSDVAVYLGQDFRLWLAANVVLQSSAAIMVAWLLSRCWFRNSPASRHTLWLSTLLFVGLIPWQAPMLEAVLRAVPLAIQTDDDVATFPTSPDMLLGNSGGLPRRETAKPALPTFDTIRSISPETVVTADTVRLTSLPMMDATTAGKLAFSIWLLGVFIGLVRMSQGLLELRRLIRRARPCDHGVRTMADGLRELSLLRSVPEVLISDEASVPLTIGWFRPRVVLPVIASSMSQSQLRQVLMHEFAHVQRGDAWVGLLQRMVLVLFWPQICLRLACNQLSQAREELCDNVVLRFVGARSYVDTLLWLAERCHVRHGLQLGLGLFAGQGKLEGRVDSLLRGNRDTAVQSRRLVKIVAGLVLIIVCGTGGYLGAVVAPAQASDEVTQAEEIGEAEKSRSKQLIPDDDDPPGREESRLPVAELSSFVPAGAVNFASIQDLHILHERFVQAPADSIAVLLRSCFDGESSSAEFPFPIQLLCSARTTSLAMGHWVAQDGSSRWVAMSRVTNPEETLASITLGLKAVSKQYATRRKTIADIPVTVHELPDQPNHYAFAQGDLAFVTNHASAINELMQCTRQRTPSLADNEAFNDIRRQTTIPTEGAAMLQWFQRHADHPLGRRAIHPWGFRHLGGTIAFPRQPEAVARHRSRLLCQDDFIPLFKQLHLQRRPDFTPETWVPEHVSGYATFHCDIARSLPAIEQMIDRAVDSPRFTQDVLSSLQNDPSGPGINLRTALLAHLGDRVSLVWGVAGSAEPWVVIHVTNQTLVVNTLVALFQDDPEAGAPRYVDDGVCIRLDLTNQPDIQLDMKSQPVEGEEVMGAYSIGVIDSQIVLATDYHALVDLAENRGRNAGLRQNRTFKSLNEKLQAEDATATGRIVALSSELALPAFVTDVSRGRVTMAKPPTRASGMNVQVSEDGLAIEGFLYPAEPAAAN